MDKALSWEVDKIKVDFIKSEPFSSGGCQWRLEVYPKGYPVDDDSLALFLEVVHPTSLRRGWRRRASYCFVLLNQSGKELYRSSDQCSTFCAEATAWGFMRLLPFTKLQEEKNKLTFQVYIKVLEVVHQGTSTENGSQILASQALPMNKIVAQHPDLEDDFIPKSQVVRTAYMNLLLGLIETLSKSPQSLSATELSNAQSRLDDLTETGFKLVDMLKSKLEEVSLERKKALSDGSNLFLQQLEERVKNVESTLSDLKIELDKKKIKSAAARVTSFEFIKRLFLSFFSISKP